MYDVIIIGAGPAGSSLAYFLAKENIKVLLLEKSKFPRYKPCGGSFPSKLFGLLDFDLSKAIERKVYGVAIHYKNESSIVAKRKDMLVFTVMREKFDYLIFEKAAKAGAICIDDIEAIQFVKEQEGITVFTKNQASFKSKILIGADGALSQVSTLIGHRKRNGFGIACEVAADADFFQNYGEYVNVVFGYIPGITGYSFPKKDHFTIGLVCMSKQFKKMKNYWPQFLKRIGLYENNIKSHWSILPFTDINNSFSAERIILIGDAAGFVDPFTGEGVFYAIKSAHIATKYIKESLLKNDFSFKGYTQEIQKEIISNLKIAKNISLMYNIIPSFFYKVSKKAPNALDLCFDVVEGKTQYNNVIGNFFFTLIRDLFKSVYLNVDVPLKKRNS